MPLAELSGFLGANLKEEKRFLPAAVGVSLINQKPGDSGVLQPWRMPLAIDGRYRHRPQWPDLRLSSGGHRSRRTYAP